MKTKILLWSLVKNMSLIIICTLIITLILDIVTGTDAPEYLFTDVACENLQKLEVGAICHHNSYHIQLDELKGLGTFGKVWKVSVLNEESSHPERYVKLHNCNNTIAKYLINLDDKTNRS